MEEARKELIGGYFWVATLVNGIIISQLDEKGTERSIDTLRGLNVSTIALMPLQNAPHKIILLDCRNADGFIKYWTRSQGVEGGPITTIDTLGLVVKGVGVFLHVYPDGTSKMTLDKEP